MRRLVSASSASFASFALFAFVTSALAACSSAPDRAASPAERSTVAAPLVVDEALQARLDQLVQKLEQRRTELHIPGMALAVVKDDAVVLAHGFGLADIEHSTPTQPDTIFAVGSTTKAFTAAVLATLIDEGKVTWDDPITRYLPYFTLAIDTDDPDAEVLLRDLLAHKTGFMRSDMLFASGTLGQEEILRMLAGAEPWDDFRESFHYNNAHYLAAGMAAGVASGSTWEALLNERILGPLGMQSTTLSIADAQRDPRLASGYAWDEDRATWDKKPMRSLDNIAPAGSINSNVLDMAQWLRLLLGRGVYEGEQLLSAERIDEMWHQEIEIAPSIGYGLGWMLREWEGRKVVEHGGNIDGFSAEVGLLPEEHLGFVLLANVSFTLLQQESLGIVWEALLGEPAVAAAPGEAPPQSHAGYDSYVGNYIADFPPFNGDAIKVLVKDGHLAADVPGQMVFDLKAPDAEGKWYFALTDTIAISFAMEDGRAAVMTIHQAGLDLECPREGYEYPVEIPLAELEPFLGRYDIATMEGDFEVLVKRNHLGLDIPGQMVFELRPPDAEGFRAARVSDRFKVRFNEEGGRIASLTFVEDGVATECPRLDPAAPLPTLDELHALRRSEERQRALDAAAPVRITGTLRFSQCGAPGTFAMTFAARDRHRLDMDLGKLGHIFTGLNERGGWAESSFEPFQEVTGDRLRQMRHAHPSASFGDWRALFDGEEITGRTSVAGRDAIELRLTDGELKVEIAVDAETGDLLGWSEDVVIPGLGTMPETIVLSDYREVEGLRVPFHMETKNDWSGRMVMDLTAVEVRVEAPESLFEPPQGS